MKRISIFLAMMMVLAMFVTPSLAATEDQSSESVEMLTKDLLATVEKYNELVTDKSSSYTDVVECTDKFYDFVDKLENEGQTVEVEPTSELNRNNRDEILPTTMSVTVLPYPTVEKSYTFTSDESKKDVLKEVYGSDISEGEYIELVFPEALKVIPDQTLQNYYETPMTWPESTHVLQDSNDLNTDVSVSQDPQTRSLIYYLMRYTSDIEEVSTSKVKFESATYVVEPTPQTKLPEMHVFSYLWKNGDTAPLTSTYKIAFNTAKVEVSKEYFVADGLYYTQGSHTCLLPLLPPQYTTAPTLTSMITVGNIA
jgi:hypothetical protein